MDFFLFILVNATLFIRPAELFPGMEDIPLFNIFMVGALLAAAPRLVESLNPHRLAAEPVSLCVVALLPAAFVSNLAHFDLWNAREFAFGFVKCTLYFLLLTVAVNNAQRFRVFLYSVALFTAFCCGMAVLHDFEVISIPGLKMLEYADMFDPETGQAILVHRIRATGLFHDPNDLAAIAVVGLVISLMGLGDKEAGMGRAAWIFPAGLFFLTLILTKSRGGMVGFVAAMGTLSYFRFGLWKTAVMGAVVVPALLLFGGRQSDLGSGLSGGTGDERVELWYEGLLAMKNFPLFGIGAGQYGEFVHGRVAHNSFVHAFVEMGLVGGTIFLGAFWFGIYGLWRLHRRLKAEYSFVPAASLRRVYPYVLAILLGFGASLLSISRNYVIPTYLVIGAGSAFCLEVRRQGLPALTPLTRRQLVRLLLVAGLFLVATYAFIKVQMMRRF